MPAIATKDEEFELSTGDIIYRRIGEILNPQLESAFILETIKKNMGSYHFSAQYQQEPLPEEGGMLKWEWFEYYDELPQGGIIVQSWSSPLTPERVDTASSDNDFADYSVGITALLYERKFYILDILRKKLNFPELKKTIIQQQKQYNAKYIIIENKGSGISMIQQLRSEYNLSILPFTPKLSKQERIMVHSGEMEAGKVLLKKGASYLDDFRSEVITFPYGKHDDQIDALSQLIDRGGAYMRPSSYTVLPRIQRTRRFFPNY